MEIECPHIRAPYNLDVYLCELNDKVCLLESGNRCEIWEEIQKEDKMWRPKNWKPFEHGDKPISKHDVFEAGADAMLEALLRRGMRYSGEDAKFLSNLALVIATSIDPNE